MNKLIIFVLDLYFHFLSPLLLLRFVSSVAGKGDKDTLITHELWMAPRFVIYAIVVVVDHVGFWLNSLFNWTETTIITNAWFGCIIVHMWTRSRSVWSVYLPCLSVCPCLPSLANFRRKLLLLPPPSYLNPLINGFINLLRQQFSWTRFNSMPEMVI